MIYQAHSIGSFASDIVKHAGDATIIAVFERSFYLLCSKGIIAVCDPALGCGPISLLVSTPRPWRQLVRVDGKAMVAADAIILDTGSRLDLGDTAVWSPPPFAAWNDDLARRGTAAAVALAVQSLTGPRARDLAMGLAPFVLTKDTALPTNPILAGAEQLLDPLMRSLPSARVSRRWPQEALNAATMLVGLGPGLTPSGDDLLGGLMLALGARGDLRLRDQLWDHIVDDLDSLTVPPSAMHMTAAAHGLAHQALHALVNEILAGGNVDLAAKLDAVLELGATSGIDAVAGVIIGLS
jgi:hypothetical protein